MKIIGITNIQHKLLPAFLAIFISAVLASGQSPVPKDSVAVKIADGFNFVEGPVWKDGVGLLFSDIPENIVYQWTPESGISVYLTPSGNSNGLALDSGGRLILAQHGNRRIARIEHNGSETDLASTYDGKKLNSPNDLAIKSDGSIFFTDPPYGISFPQEELGFRGIFRISPAGDLQLLDSSLEYPNGITFSPDETKLYAGHSETMTVYVWDVVDDTTITNKQVFAQMPLSCCTDGMKVDTAGNLFASGPAGIWVYSPEGAVLDTIPVPGQTTNCCWGDTDRKTLYITSGDAVYRIRVETGGLTGHKDGIKTRAFELYPGYPNPFSSETTITYSVPSRSFISLKIYDMQGNEVKTLVNEKKDPGKYEISFDPDFLSEGTYFCHLLAGNEFSEIKKILLLK